MFVFIADKIFQAPDLAIRILSAGKQTCSRGQIENGARLGGTYPIMKLMPPNSEKSTHSSLLVLAAMPRNAGSAFAGAAMR